MTVELKLGTLTRQVGPTNPRIMIGRDEHSCELWIHDESVSRRHAEVFLQGHSIFIRDLGSSNGTWVNGQPLGPNPVELGPGQIVYVGHAPLGVEWTQPGGGRAATVMAALPPELMAMMAQRRQQMAHSAPSTGFSPGQPMGYGQPPGQPMGFAQPQPTAAPIGSPAAHQAQQSLTSMGVGVAATVGVGGTQGPTPAELTYRSQGSNNNGTLLIALPGDTFANDNTINGFLEFTATDNETVASIFVELVEYHKKGPKQGHVWDRCLARQGPWKTKKGDVLPMPFALRVPSGTSISAPDCYWQLRGYVDISWALDIEATININMRNCDIEKIRDALGALDYRINTIASKPLGQKYTGKFNPPMHLRKQLNITDINLDIEYLGTNLKVVMEVEKNKFFHRDKRQEFVFALDMLRNASLADVSNHFQTEINKLMS
jgi:hypothetical protein